MSTRANVLLVDAHTNPNNPPLVFYRHSDGYPEGVEPTLKKFCEWIKSEKIRNNLMQAAGWLVILGLKEHAEQATLHPGIYVGSYNSLTTVEDLEPGGESLGWKVGYYEPVVGVTDWAEFVYVVDVTKGEYSVYPFTGSDVDEFVRTILKWDKVSA